MVKDVTLEISKLASENTSEVEIEHPHPRTTLNIVHCFCPVYFRLKYYRLK